MRTPKAPRNQTGFIEHFARSALECDGSSHRFFIGVPEPRFATQKSKMKTPVIIRASIQTKSMLNHACRNIAIPSFS